MESSQSVIGSSGGRGPGSGPRDAGGHLAQIFVNLLEGGARDISAIELANAWRKEAAERLTRERRPELLQRDSSSPREEP